MREDRVVGEQWWTDGEPDLIVGRWINEIS